MNRSGQLGQPMDGVTTLKTVMLVASIALQAYGVWALRRLIKLRVLLPYFAGGAATVAPGIYLLLNAPTTIYLLGLGGFLTTYGIYMLLGSPLRLRRNTLTGRVIVGALGGITGATSWPCARRKPVSPVLTLCSRCPQAADNGGPPTNLAQALRERSASLTRAPPSGVSANLAMERYIQRIMAHRTTAREAGTIFARAKPKLAAFTHLVFLASEKVPPASIDDLIAETRQSYDGPLVVGEDLMSFEIGETVQVLRTANQEM
ncbi:MAG: hypothetical protein ACREC6_02555 [Hyphomicrobiaceae bacterium]